MQKVRISFVSLFAFNLLSPNQAEVLLLDRLRKRFLLSNHALVLQMFHVFGLHTPLSRREAHQSRKGRSRREHDLVSRIGDGDCSALQLEPPVDLCEYDLHECGSFCPSGLDER